MPMDAKGQEYHEELVQQIIDAGRYLIEHAESMVDAEEGEDMPLTGFSIHIDFPQGDRAPIPEISWTTESFISNTVKRWVKEEQEREES